MQLLLKISSKQQVFHTSISLHKHSAVTEIVGRTILFDCILHMVYCGIYQDPCQIHVMLEGFRMQEGRRSSSYPEHCILHCPCMFCGPSTWTSGRFAWRRFARAPVPTMDAAVEVECVSEWPLCSALPQGSLTAHRRAMAVGGHTRA